MKATVITTGPGVIIATATASRNWRSVSQWCSCTTPPYRNGTIASPLPNTNAPAFAKNQNSEAIDALVAGGARATASTSGLAQATTARGGDGVHAATIEATPARTKSQTISRSYHAVVAAATTKMIHSTRRGLIASRISLYVERAMMPMTAA